MSRKNKRINQKQISRSDIRKNPNTQSIYDFDHEETDPLTGYPATLRTIQGFQATKTYICPECNDLISTGTKHLVVVPIDAPDLRRHWHSYCWVRKSNRTPYKKT